MKNRRGGGGGGSHSLAPLDDLVLVAGYFEADACLLEPHDGHVGELDLVTRGED